MRLSIGAKLLGGFALVITIALVLAGVTVSRMGGMNESTHVISDSDLPSVRTIGTIDARQGDYRSAQYRLIAETTPGGIRRTETDLAAADKAVGRAFRQYGVTVADAKDRRLWRQAQAFWAEYQQRSAAWRTLARTNRNVEATQALQAVEPLYDRLTEQLGQWAAYNKRLADGDAAAAQDAYTSSRSIVIGLGVLLTVLSAGIAVLLTRSIRRSATDVLTGIESLRDHEVADLRAAITSMADGDLTQTVTPVGVKVERITGDELGRVAEALNTIVDAQTETVASYEASRQSLVDILTDVDRTAGLLSTSSEEMATTSEEAGRAVGEIAQAVSEMAHGAERQVQSVDGARLNVEHLSSSARESADTAAAAREEATEAERVAQEGAASIGHASEVMQAVTGASQQASEAIQRLGEKSAQIGSIVQTITAIADQTNLLALNAAIEAARAGEQGRGFAVVADEVRQLAEESQEAAASIAGLISEIQGETDQAVAVVRSGAEQTVEGATTVRDAQAAFEQIATQVHGMNDRIGQLAAAATDIATASTAINDEVTGVASIAEEASASSEEVSASTEQTSASAQQIAASAQQLASTATELNDLVRRFRISA